MDEEKLCTLYRETYEIDGRENMKIIFEVKNPSNKLVLGREATAMSGFLDAIKKQAAELNLNI